MTRRAITVSLLSILPIVAQAQIEIPKEWRGKTQAELLAIPEIGRMPFVAQDQIVGALDSAYGALPWSQRQQPLLAAEREHAAAERRNPRSVLVWDKGASFSFDYYTDGEHYYAILKHPLFISIKLVEYEKYVRAWVYVSSEKGSSLKFDVFTRNISYSSIAPRPELREPVSADQVAKSIRNGSRWRAALVAGLGGFATTTATTQESGTFNGSAGSATVNGSFSGSSTTTAPDYAARQRALNNASGIRSEAERKSDGITLTAFRDNTVFPGSEVNGFVYFKRDRAHDASGVLRVILGTLSIEFPVKW